MHLGLEEADAGVELGDYVDVLIIGGVQAGKGGVVGADVGYVGVGSGAEVGRAVA